MHMQGSAHSGCHMRAQGSKEQLWVQHLQPLDSAVAAIVDQHKS
jgi:hypothetical protein